MVPNASQAVENGHFALLISDSKNAFFSLISYQVQSARFNPSQAKPENFPALVHHIGYGCGVFIRSDTCSKISTGPLPIETQIHVTTISGTGALRFWTVGLTSHTLTSYRHVPLPPLYTKQSPPWKTIPA